MKTIIAGSRDFTDYRGFLQGMGQQGWEPTEVVSGGARGADRLGERWARYSGIPIKQFIPDWDKHGKRAGFIRNTKMAEYAEGLIAFWDGRSRGTKHMIDEALQLGLHVLVFNTLRVPILEGGE